MSDSDLLTRDGMEVTLSLKRAVDPEFIRQLHSALENPERRVAEVMTREVVTISPEASLGAAARLMVERHLKRLPVVDAEGRLVGILGRLDVLNTIAAAHLLQWHPGARPSAAAARDVMDREPAVAHASATLGEILELLVGMVGRTEPMRALLGAPTALAAPSAPNAPGGSGASGAGASSAPARPARPRMDEAVLKIRSRQGRADVSALLRVGLGGFFGANARYLLGGWVAARSGALFPWGTFVINIRGSFIVGFFLAFAQDRSWVAPSVRLLFAVGFVGAYTTFSTYTYGSLRLLQDGQLQLAAFNIVGSVIAGLIAVFAGAALDSAG